MKTILLFLSLIISTLVVKASDPETYIAKYKHIAIQEMKASYIPASIKLAQGILESDFGKGELATKANNHFGIKCGSDWNGATYEKVDDDLDSEGNLIPSCFRSFESVEESYQQHTAFLTNPKKAYRYGFLFRFASDDYVSWAVGLLKAGYATDPNYSKKLISIIENFELFKYDQKIAKTPKKIIKKAKPKTEVKTKEKPKVERKKKSEKKRKSVKKENRKKSKTRKTRKPSPKPTRSKNVKENPIETPPAVVEKKAPKTSKRYGLKCVKAQPGETPSIIADRHEIHLDRLLSYNKGLDPNQILRKGEVLYLEPKNNFYRGDKISHIVKKGETMSDISQKYGIKLDILYERNRIPFGAQPLVGEKINFKYINVFSKPKYKMPKEKDEFLF